MNRMENRKKRPAHYARFYKDEVKRATAQKLGITVNQLEKIQQKIEDDFPKFNKGYDYNSVLLFLIAHGKEIQI